jgi:restriction system protein
LETRPTGENRFENTIRWTRQTLVQRGDLSSAGYGVWAITDKGRARLRQASADAQASGQRPAEPAQNPPTDAVPVPQTVGPSQGAFNLEEAHDDYVEAFTDRVLQTLREISPAQFEQFAAKLMEAYGFQNVKTANAVTAPDGGIDGEGDLRVGLAKLHAAFQCKRWKGPVPRPEIDKFRGAIQGQCEHGYFFTTSRFTEEAQKAAIKPGSVPIFLFDGREIVKIMIEKRLGVIRTPIEVYRERAEAILEPPVD